MLTLLVAILIVAAAFFIGMRRMPLVAWAVLAVVGAALLKLVNAQSLLGVFDYSFLGLLAWLPAVVLGLLWPKYS